MTSQWIGFAVAMLIIGGLLYAFLRDGVKIKPDPDSKPPSDRGRDDAELRQSAWHVSAPSTTPT